MGLESGRVCVFLGVIASGDRGSLSNILRRVFADSAKNGCWKVEIHVFAMGFDMRGVVESTRDAILSNIYLSLLLYEHAGLGELDSILKDIGKRIGDGNVVRVYVYSSPGIGREALEKIRSSIPSKYLEILGTDT